MGKYIIPILRLKTTTENLTKSNFQLLHPLKYLLKALRGAAGVAGGGRGRGDLLVSETTRENAAWCRQRRPGQRWQTVVLDGFLSTRVTEA